MHRRHLVVLSVAVLVAAVAWLRWEVRGDTSATQPDGAKLEAAEPNAAQLAETAADAADARRAERAAVPSSESGASQLPSLPGNRFAGKRIRVEGTRGIAVAGRVVDPVGAPVPEATVDVIQRSEGAWPVFTVSESTQADSEGRFALPGLTLAGTRLRARAAGHADSLFVRIDPALAERGEAVVVALQKGGSVVVDVVGEGGTARGEWSVALRRTLGLRGLAAPSNRSAVTDAAGRVRFEHVAEGSYFVGAMPNGDRDNGSDDQVARSWRQAIEMEHSGDERGRSEQALEGSLSVVVGEEAYLCLDPARSGDLRLVGQVTRKGTPVPDVQVRTYGGMSAFGSDVNAGQTGAHGIYEVFIDGPGEYDVNVVGGPAWSDSFTWSMQYRVDVPDVREWRLNLALPSASVFGRVSNPAGEPLPSVNVVLVARTPGVFPRRQSRATRAGGVFRFRNLPGGSYELRAGGARGYGMQTLPVEVRENEVTEEIELTLSLAGSVVGRVRDASGLPVPEATVFVRDSSGRLLEGQSSAWSDDDGEFRYDGLAEGPVYLSAMAADRVSPVEIQAMVASEQETEVEIRLEPGTLLEIAVADASGPLSGASIEVVDDDGHDYARMQRVVFSESELSAGWGRPTRRVGPVPPGAYTLRVTTRSGQVQTERLEVRGRSIQRVEIQFPD